MTESRIAYAAAGWALAFAVLHIVWALGCYVGLDPESARRAFQQPFFLAYDIVVAVICALAVLVALSLARPASPLLPRRVTLFLGWTGTLLLALRGAAGVSYALYLEANGRDVSRASMFWEVWFCLGAVLFGLSAWHARRRSPGL